MANDFDGQIDYLEQFGCSSVSKFLHISPNYWTVIAHIYIFNFFFKFKESALRKQSLYLKFDPLLRESPKKPAGPAVNARIPRPPAFTSQYGICLFYLV